MKRISMLRSIALFTLFFCLALDGGVVRKPKTFRILVAGDVMFDWGLRDTMEKKGFYAPVESLAPLFSEADYRIVNLETPVSESDKDIDKVKPYVFNAKPEELKLLNYLNVDLVSLANNHSMDYGKQGLEETLVNLKKFNISSMGAGKNLASAEEPYLLNNDYGQFEIFGQSAIGETRLFATNSAPGAAPFSPQRLIGSIDKSKPSLKILMVHWGIEYRPEPTLGQINQAKSLINAGFQVVVGHHPHIPQGIQKYKNGIIFYSLGNFIFGSRNQYLNHNLAALLHFRDGKLRLVEVIPIFGKFQKSDHLIRPLEGTEADSFLMEIAVLSERLGTKLIVQNGRGYIYF